VSFVVIYRQEAQLP